LYFPHFSLNSHFYSSILPVFHPFFSDEGSLLAVGGADEQTEQNKERQRGRRGNKLKMGGKKRLKMFFFVLLLISFFPFSSPLSVFHLLPF